MLNINSCQQLEQSVCRVAYINTAWGCFLNHLEGRIPGPRCGWEAAAGVVVWFPHHSTAERTQSLLLDVAPQGGNWAMVSKISCFSSAVVTNEEPSRRILIMTDDLEMSPAIKYYDLREITHVAPQEKWMTTHEGFVPRFDLGSPVSPVEIFELPQDHIRRSCHQLP